jgi:predicted ATPase
MGRTLTFLFTDVESSTQRWHDDADGMAAALAIHDEVLDRCIQASEGRTFKHTGDGVCAVFDSAGRAVAAAIEAQEALSLPVRMGVHTGEVEERDGDFFGTTLNRCARIMDAGHGGQVLISTVTRSLVDGIECLELGEYELKGLAEPERIFQVGTMPFPALRTPRCRSFLPGALTSLVGRDDLVADVARRLRAARLVTLVGVGGVGKTRVAVAAAEQIASNYELGVFVDLTEVSDDDDVVSAFARSLGLSSPTMASIGVALSGRRVLVVLDNCEHVLDAAADLVSDVLGLSPSATVLATSREALAIDGEQLVAVPALDVLDQSSPAVALFLDRARAADPSFGLRDGDAARVEEVCRRLDGLPLAIELAAARVGVLSITDLLARLDARFEVLTGGRRRRSRDRQRTLRETVDWSYELLHDDERRAFAVFSVFAGSFGLDGASAVLGETDQNKVLDLVEALVAKSLLTVTDIDSFRRYRYLETLRSYADERLREHGDDPEVMRLLHLHLVSVVHHSREEFDTRPTRAAARLRMEIPNLRRAFDDALDRLDVGAAAALIVPFSRMLGAIDWHISGWAAEVLALDATAGTVHEPELLALHAIDRWLDNDFSGLHRLAEQMLERAAALDVVSGGVEAVAMWLFQLAGDDEAASSSDSAAISSPDTYDGVWLTRARIWTRLVPARPGADLVLDADDAAAVEALVHNRSIPVQGLGCVIKALWAQRRGDFEAMLTLSRQAEQLFIEGSANWFCAMQIRGWAEWELGRMADAIRTADDDLEQAYRYGDRSAMIIPLTIYALVLRSLEEAETSATVRGRLPRRLTVLLVAQLLDLDRWLDGRLDADRHAELGAQGRSMNPRDLQALTHTVAARHLELHVVDSVPPIRPAGEEKPSGPP